MMPTPSTPTRPSSPSARTSLSGTPLRDWTSTGARGRICIPAEETTRGSTPPRNQVGDGKKQTLQVELDRTFYWPNIWPNIFPTIRYYRIFGKIPNIWPNTEYSGN